MLTMNQWAWPEDGERWQAEERLEPADGQPFHIGQGYENRVAQRMRCKCGGEEFHLARDDYYTAIRCLKCRMEVCVHEG